MLQLENVSKTFGNTVAVHGTDLSVPSGQTTVVLGPAWLWQIELPLAPRSIRVDAGRRNPGRGTGAVAAVLVRSRGTLDRAAGVAVGQALTTTEPAANH